jgi:chromosome segregation ATPase
MEEDIYKTLPVPAMPGLTQKSQSLASPQTSVDKQRAAKAQTFAYSPDQARQGLDIGVARRTEESQRTYKVLQNQQTQATLQEIKRVEQQIVSENQKANEARSQAAQARGQVGSINSQIASINSQIAGINSQIAAKQAKIATQPVVKKGDAYTDPRYIAAEARIKQMVAINDWEAIKAATADRNALLAELNAQGIM